MKQIKLNDYLTIQSADIVWPDELGFTVKFKVSLDSVPYSLHMQTENGECYFTDAPFYGYKKDYSDLYDLLNQSDYEELLIACKEIYNQLKGE